MPKARTEPTSVATYPDHEVITPPNRLRKALSTVSSADADDQVARAEAALAKLSDQFGAWMKAECTRLHQARCDVQTAGFTEVTRQALFLAAHDIRGEADTFGYPLVAAPADSLCRLIEHTPDTARIPVALVDQHVDAIRAIIREHAGEQTEAMATALTRKLREVTEDFLARESASAATAPDGALAPPLAPDDRSA